MTHASTPSTLPADTPPTRTRAIQGAFWAASGSLVRYGLAGLTVLILSRLLQPRDFGLAAIAAIMMTLIGHIATVGFHDALIQRPHLDETDLDTAFWSILGLAGGAALLVAGLSPLLAALYDRPALAPLFVGMALAGLIHASSIVPRALLSRQMDFRTPALVHAAGMVVGGLGAVLLAALGGGPWSRVLQFTLISLVGCLLVWRAIPWRPTRRFSRPSARQMWGFASSVSIFTVLATIIASADDQLVGYRLGPEALGYYAMAYSFMAWPVRDVLGGIAVVIYPVFARFQGDLPRLQAAYLEGNLLATAVGFPTLTMIVITAPVLIPFLLGERWTPSVLTAQILAVGGLREATMMLNGQVYRAIGKPLFHMMLGAASAVCFLVAFVLGLQEGIEGVAFYFCLAGLLIQPAAWWLILSVLHISLWRWLAALIPTATATALMALAATPTLHVVRNAGWSAAPALLLTGLVAGTVYTITLALMAPEGLKRTLQVLLDLARQKLVIRTVPSAGPPGSTES